MIKLKNVVRPERKFPLTCLVADLPEKCWFKAPGWGSWYYVSRINSKTPQCIYATIIDETGRVHRNWPLTSDLKCEVRETKP
jgi:hypothetical protein